MFAAATNALVSSQLVPDDADISVVHDHLILVGCGHWSYRSNKEAFDSFARFEDIGRSSPHGNQHHRPGESRHLDDFLSLGSKRIGWRHFPTFPRGSVEKWSQRPVGGY
jgi:hypothetical protein